MIENNFANHYLKYCKNLSDVINITEIKNIEILAGCLKKAWVEKKQVFIFGNGGSAGNAIHLANDLIYGVSKSFGNGLRIHALPANSSVLTCLANDEGYDNIFNWQLATLAQKGDVAIALSGSGNSKNIINGLQYCKKNGIKTFAILGYDGGQAKKIVDHPIHVPISDMQISEDMQIIIGHILMRWLSMQNV